MEGAVTGKEAEWHQQEIAPGDTWAAMRPGGKGMALGSLRPGVNATALLQGLADLRAGLRGGSSRKGGLRESDQGDQTNGSGWEYLEKGRNQEKARSHSGL